MNCALELRVYSVQVTKRNCVYLRTEIYGPAVSVVTLGRVQKETEIKCRSSLL